MVRRVLRGEVEVYREIVRRYGDTLYRHAERMVGPTDAPDLVQVAFLTGYRRLASCEPERVGGWLFRILANRCRDHLKDRRRTEVPLDEIEIPPTSGGPEEDLRRAELGRELRRALDRLTPEQREAFLLKHYEGHSYEEMARMLDVAPAALKMRVHRAREALRDIMEERAWTT